MKSKNCLIITLLLLALLSTACTQAAPVYAAGSEKEQAVAAAAPLAKEILDGMQQNDYALFSKDFDAAMLKSLPQSSFATMLKTFSAYGAFKSSDLINVEIVENYYSAAYKLTYANQILTMRVVFPKSGTPQVSGLWFK